MPGRHVSVTLSAVLSGSVLVLAACSGGSGDSGSDGTPDTPSKLFATDFQPVCSGATQSRAADYSSAETHKALYFETYEEDLLDQSSTLPSDWTVVFDENADAYAQVDVVACAVRTADELARTCEGYEDEEAGTSGTVRWHTATYELTVYAALSGEALGSTTLEAGDDTCPSLATFDEGQTEIDVYASPSDDEVTSYLETFLRP